MAWKKTLMPVVALIGFAFAQSARALEQPTLTCDSLEVCLAFVTRPYACISSEPDCDVSGSYIPYDEGYFTLPDAFQKFGRAGVPPLLGLLRHPDATVRVRAALVLGGSNFLQPSDRAEIIAAWNARVGWIDSAFAKLATAQDIVQTVEAVEKSETFDEVQEGLLVELGTKVVPELLSRLRCDPGACDERYVVRLARVLSRFEDDVESAQTRFIEIALQDKNSEKARNAALRFIGSRKNLNATMLEKLRPLMTDKYETVREMATTLLVRNLDDAAVEPATRRVERGHGFDRTLALMDLAKLGERARSSGPRLRHYLKDDDWNVRAQAAETLGSMGDHEAVPLLIDAIGENDWLLSFSAVSVLGRLGGPEAEAAMHDKSSKHWHPAVRKAAENILAGFPALPPGDSPADSLLTPANRYCKSLVSKDEAPDSLRNGSTQKDMDDFNAWNHRNWTAYANAFRTNEHLKSAVQPGINLRYGEWSFTGTDNGEWGGGLIVRKDSGGPQALLDENVQAVFTVGDRVMAVTGRNHMMDWGGFLHDLVQDERGNWKAMRRFRLTGAPHVILVAPDGTIGALSGGGSMLIHPDGKAEWLSCAPP